MADGFLDGFDPQTSDTLNGDPEILNPYEDKLAVGARIDRTLSIDRFQRSLFEREWFRNILFLAGQQWIIYERGRWRPRALPAWFPRAQTNKFAEKYNDIIAQLVQGRRIPITYLPARDQDDDRATAEVGQRLREVIYAEAEIDDKEEEVAAWLVATGNAFVLPHYDMDDSYGMNTVQSQQCMVCNAVSSPEEIEQAGGNCPACQQMGMESNEFQPAQDENGEPIGEEYPVGAIQGDVCSPFEIRLDHRIINWKEHRRFVRMRRYDLDYAKEHWDEFADNITADTGDDLSQYYLDVIAHVTGSFSASGGFMGGGPSSPKNPKVTAYEFYELPSEKFPEGIRAIRLGPGSSTIVEAGPLPTKYGAGVKKGKCFLPGVPFRFDRIPGRFWGKTRLDDLVPLQIFRNTVEANLRLSAQRMGNAIWLKPKGSGVASITGEPGQEIEYNPVSMGGQSFAKPERVPAELNNLQPLIMLMKVIDDSMERVAGTFFLQGGDTPPGVTAASALAYLGERAQKSMSPLMTSWAKAWRDFELMALEIARQNWDDDRIRIIAGKNKKWQSLKFSKADLQGAVNLTIDYNGLFPKSNATERATIAQLIQLGVVNPQDPEQQWELLKAFGETNLKGSQDIDEEDAVKEADQFMNDPMFVPTIRPFVDNSIVHLKQHTDLAKTDEFRELPPERQDQWIAHIQATVADIVTRRIMLTQAGLDPDSPATAEVSSGDAQAMLQQMAGMMNGQPGGPPDGSEQHGPGGPKGKAGRGKPKPGAAAEMPNPDEAGGGPGPDMGLPPGIPAIRQAMPPQGAE